MSHLLLPSVVSLLLVFCSLPLANGQQQPSNLRDGLRFYCSFDSDTAEVASGDAHWYHAPTLERKELIRGLPKHVQIVESGYRGKCLQFKDVSEQVMLARGESNMPYSPESFAATISLWMRVDPEKDLKPGYVDPLQITDKKWNDASLFIDFTADDKPRQFRMGVFSDYKFWNPKDVGWDDIQENDRPMVVQPRPQFSSQEWTHVVLMLKDVNLNKPATASLYVNAKEIGKLHEPLKLTWDPEELAIMLGIQYIGFIDELAIFDRAMSPAEISQLFQLKTSLAELPETSGR